MSQQLEYKKICATVSQKNLYLGLSILLWFLVGARANVQNDTWWHLRTGQLIADTHSIPTIDSYSWVLRDHAPWPNHEWLSQLLFYLLFTVGGPAALHLLIAGLFATAAAFFFLAMRGRYEVRALNLTALLPWIATASTIRPHAFTITFTAVTLYTLLNRRFWCLPILLLVWVQFHGGVCFGGLILMAALVVTLCTLRSLLPHLFVVVALAGASVAINPLGIEIYTHPFTSTAMARALPLQEWAPPGFEYLLGQIFWALAVCLCVLAMVRWRRLRNWEVAVLAVTTIAVFPLAARHVRNVYLWMPIASVTATHLLSTSDIAKPVNSIKYLAVLASSTVAVLVLAGLSIAETTSSTNWHPVSAETVDVLETAQGHLFNTYDTGGYLIWFSPKTKVFIDSRQDPYPIKLLQETIEAQRSGEFTEFFSGFGFTTAVVEPQMPLARALVASGWSEAAKSPAFSVFVAPRAPAGVLP